MALQLRRGFMTLADAMAYTAEVETIIRVSEAEPDSSRILNVAGVHGVRL